LLLPTFKNLKTLELISYNHNKIINLKNIISLPKIESASFYIRYQPFLSGLSDFINSNGKNLKHLAVDGVPEDSGFLRRLFQSIAQCCINLEDLSIFYDNELDQELMEVFNNCMKLKSIIFSYTSGVDKLDGDKILTVLNQTLPKKLRSIISNCWISNINDHS